MSAITDGTFTIGKQNGPRRILYPFANTPLQDVSTKVYEHDHIVFPVSGYSPGQATRNVGVPILESTESLDGSDTVAYLCTESPLAISGGVGSFTRTYANIPSSQTVYGSRIFDRPNMSGLKSGSTYAACYDPEKGLYSSTHLHSSRKSVLGTSTSQGGSIGGALPSTNITCTDTDGHTATFAANASVGTVTAALASLTNLFGFSAATDGTTLAFYWKSTVGKAMVSITPAASTVDIKWSGGSAFVTALGNTIVPDLTLLYCPSHGAIVGEKCGLWNGNTLVHVGSVAGVSDANNLSINVSDMSSPDFNITHATFSSAASYRYANGPKMIRIKEVSDYYLPGVTGGITTFDDIPLVTAYSHPQAWLDQIVAGTAFVAIETNNIDQWMGPIYVRKVTYAKMSSALESLSLT